eukprot:GDKH01006134.1.p1 GENE.GDKH01006134.1~~GDKH01006134.1.p1  ORF type:complete len:207 (+),score=32.47 GDKH01006134.1:120-740(+)
MSEDEVMSSHPSESESEDEGSHSSSESEVEGEEFKMLKDDANQDIKGFSTSFRNILAKEVEGGRKKKVPILIEKKEVEESIQARRTERKLQQQLAAERKRLKNIFHVPVDVLKLPQERQLKKTATKGVVKLFGAVMEFRRRTLLKDADEAATALKDKGVAISSVKAVKKEEPKARSSPGSKPPRPNASGRPSSRGRSQSGASRGRR